MLEKQSHNCNCRRGCLSSFIPFLAAFLVIPLIVNLLTFNLPTDSPVVDIPTQDIPNDSTPDTPDEPPIDEPDEPSNEEPDEPTPDIPDEPPIDEPEEEIVLDTTGFKDYALPYTSSYSYNGAKYNESSIVNVSGISSKEIIEADGDSYLQYSRATGYYGDAYVNYFDSDVAGMTTQNCNGILISFDIAKTEEKLFDKFMFVLRDSSDAPLGSSKPYTNLYVPNVCAQWQHVVLDYNFRDNTCDIYIDGVKTEYGEAFKNYSSTTEYSISTFRFMIDYSSVYSKTYLNNFEMCTYTEFNEELINEFDTKSGEILDMPIAYVDGIPYYTLSSLEKALTGDIRKDLVIVADYQISNSYIRISCPVRMVDSARKNSKVLSGLELIGEKDGIQFYDFKKT